MRHRRREHGRHKAAHAQHPAQQPAQPPLLQSPCPQLPARRPPSVPSVPLRISLGSQPQAVPEASQRRCPARLAASERDAHAAPGRRGAPLERRGSRLRLPAGADQRHPPFHLPTRLPPTPLPNPLPPRRAPPAAAWLALKPSAWPHAAATRATCLSAAPVPLSLRRSAQARPACWAPAAVSPHRYLVPLRCCPSLPPRPPGERRTTLHIARLRPAAPRYAHPVVATVAPVFLRCRSHSLPSHSSHAGPVPFLRAAAALAGQTIFLGGQQPPLWCPQTPPSSPP